MEKIIPRHCVVIGIGPDPIARGRLIEKHFESHEILSPDRVTRSLVGEGARPDLNGIVFPEIRRLIALKLSLGERAVIDAANLRREDRVSLARIAADHGVPCFYLICDPSGASDLARARFESSERELLLGDGLAEIIDWRFHTPKPIPRAQADLDEIRATWSGITIVSDVHGMYSSLLEAVSWARRRGHYLVFLGDLIDYGVETLSVADEVYRIVMRGEGEILLGNHERKIARWITQSEAGRVSLRLSDGNRVTTNALNALGQTARRRWIGRFRGLVAHGGLIRSFGDITLAHAAVHPGFWDGTAGMRDIENHALFGQFEAADGERLYGWCDAVPEGDTVIVGHDIRSTVVPMQVEGRAGGRTIFLDTGCGKGGALTTADLKFVGEEVRLGNFNRY